MIRASTVLHYLDSSYIPARLSLCEGSAEQLRVAVRRFDAWLGRPANLSDLTAGTVTSYLRAELQTLSAETVKRRRGALLSIWTDAADAGLIEPPPRRLPTVRTAATVPTAWSLDEMAAIVAACRRVPGRWEGCPAALCWHLGVSVLWDSACRIGSLLAARVADVDLDRSTWHVPAAAIKGRHADRLFRLHAETTSLIRESVTDWPAREMLFPFPHGRRQVWSHLRRILDDAGLPTTRRDLFHKLRRSAESHAAASLGSAAAAELVGHSEAVARKSYVAPDVARQASLADVLPRI